IEFVIKGGKYLMKKVAIITSGGAGSGINSAIEMISRENLIDLYGFHDGFKGILNNDLVHLTKQYCQHNSLNGTQFVGTARTDAMNNKTSRQRTHNVVGETNCSYLNPCGGAGPHVAALPVGEDRLASTYSRKAVEHAVIDGLHTIGFGTALTRLKQTADV